MMAKTAEIAKPKNSRLLQSNRCFKLPTTGWIIFFFALGFLGRFGGFCSRVALGLGLIFTGLSGLTGLFIWKNIKAQKHN
jgi:hypothetical protein